MGFSTAAAQGSLAAADGSAGGGSEWILRGYGFFLKRISFVGRQCGGPRCPSGKPNE
jgi:hypothetical protein